MPHLLHIDSSARLEGSVSRDLGQHFLTAWRKRGADYSVTHRDLAKMPVPQIEQATIAGFYTAPADMTADLRAATAVSDELIAELKSADELLLTTPMYNFTVPSALKAWIDQIFRINHTFSYDGQSFKGLVTSRRATVISAYGAGGFLNGGPLVSADFCWPYLKFAFGFLGISEINQIAVEATTGDPAALAGQVRQARTDAAVAAAA
jgi:FMN-dependent NADH-azoreductase